MAVEEDRDDLRVLRGRLSDAHRDERPGRAARHVALSWKNKWGDRAETAEGHGGLCVLGRFGFQYIDSKERLAAPLVRTEDGLTPESWYDAINLVKDRLATIKAQHGPNAIAGLITARCTNEELYLFQKFMRVVIGTNQLDSSARYGHLNFVRAMQHAAGVGRMMSSYVDITKAKAILVIGADITETNPITGLAREGGAAGVWRKGGRRRFGGHEHREAGVASASDCAGR